ncbi:DUF2059 domain-containing protein [Jannaschia seohaensis]|uniref:Uncharacterized protein DUF2059 n=1 Tax=Jannaschia seohaensis TaxID=475081 RepID=A0A2Y9ANT0_9RHOB|nr:DUF2059 domain-containing protein [Jannaschia seohaensis]PWJ19368.1 uncharacterized protein DUF2059 [Jannaschia seohaensis]SSA46030.1 hypothetical protein SAMN05421539_104305 [Jannaschia seohaensis]
MNKKARIAATLLLGVALAGGAARAEPQAADIIRIETIAQSDLLTVTQMGPLMRIVATEGARHGISLERALFPGKGGEGWRREVARIQAPERLTPFIHESLAEILRPGDLKKAHAFYASDLGQRIVGREVYARRQMLDGSVEAEAKQASATLLAADAPRALLIDQLIDSLDLVATNVSGGMNANFAFYRGLADGGALAERLAETDMLAMVREQEPEIRTATLSWLRAYLMMAYTPLSDEELARYVAFARTDAGKRYNAAMFEGFGRVFESTSYELGRAAARYMVATDI